MQYLNNKLNEGNKLHQTDKQKYMAGIWIHNVSQLQELITIHNADEYQ